MTPITTNADLVAFCALLKNEPYVCVDTEFMRESTYWPILCLIQASGPNHCAVIDPMAPGLDLQPFLDLMTDESLAKVFHAARQDVEIFSNLKGLPKNLFDTQIAAMAAGYGEQIAYDALVRQILRIEIDKSSRFTDWSRRPLSEAQLDYALADVTHLAKLYPKLKDKLEKSGRLAWVGEEMAALCDPATYDVDPEKAWRRLKPRKFNAKYLAAFRATACSPSLRSSAAFTSRPSLAQPEMAKFTCTGIASPASSHTCSAHSGSLSARLSSTTTTANLPRRSAASPARRVAATSTFDPTWPEIH